MHKPPENELEGMAEEIAQQLVLEWLNGGTPHYSEQFTGLIGLPKDARVLVEVRLVQPLRVEQLAGGVTWRLPVGTGT
jgi:hypothetical protein